jgi:hypothetical protein
MTEATPSADPYSPSVEPKRAGLLKRLNGRLKRLNARINRWLSETVERHVVAAFIMVTISVLGAAAAYRVGVAEQRSIVLERRLAHAQLQDIGFRQQYLAEVLMRVGLESAQKRLLREAGEMRRGYEQLASLDPQMANWFEWRAAELVLQRNVLRRFLHWLHNLGEKHLDVEEHLAKHSAAQLRSQGLLPSIDPAAKQRSAVKFPTLSRAIAKHHEISAALALCVLMFVSGLVFLTLAELDLGPPIVWITLVATGVAAALWATHRLLTFDPDSGALVAALSAALAAIGALAWRAGVFQIEHDPAHAPHPEAPEPRVSFAHLSGRLSHDDWSRMIVILIAATVFVSAVFGWLYSVSLKHAGHFALEAQDKRAELVNQRARLAAVAMGGQFETAIQILAERIRCGSATQFAALVDEGMIDFNAAMAQAERKQRCKDLEEYVKNKGELVHALDNENLVDSATGPARRLADEIIDRAGGPELTLALTDGYSEISSGWSRRAALLLAVLTILAIALYLFGQAYAMGPTLAGRWLVRSGGALLGFAICLGLFAWTRQIVPAPAELPPGCALSEADDQAAGASEGSEDDDRPEDDEARDAKLAAARYAEGVRQINIATTAKPQSRARAVADAEAIASLECAIAARPGFILAYRRYVERLSIVGSPQRSEGGPLSLYTRVKLRELVEARRRELLALADAQLLRPMDQLNGYAFMTTVLALVDGNARALDEAGIALASLTKSASRLQQSYIEFVRPELWSEEPRDPSSQILLNRGLALLATGEPEQIDAALRTYGEALNKTKPPVPKGKLDEETLKKVKAQALKPADYWTPELLAAALTDLEILRTYCNRLHDTPTCNRIVQAIDRVRPLVAAGRVSENLPSESAAQVREFSATVTPYALSWSARIDGFNAAQDRLTIAWFKDDTRMPDEPEDATDWQMRRALPDFFDMFYPEGGMQLPKPDTDGVTRRTALAIPKSQLCVAPGRYVAELFLNGKHVDTKTVTLELHNLQTFRSRELDLMWCVPQDWQPWSGEGGSHQWSPDKPVRGFVIPPPIDLSILLKRDSRKKRGTMIGAAMMTFLAPPSMTGEMRKAYFLRRAFQILLRKGETQSVWSQRDEDRLLRTAKPLENLKSECQESKTLGPPAYRYFVDRSEKNLIHIAVVGGNVRGKDVCTILSSLTNYY